jgi:hypothetical protein
MKRKQITGLCLLVLAGIGVPALGGEPDANQCLECHEPAEDWAGLSVVEIMQAAKAPDNKRHENNQALSDEDLRLIIAKLLPQ